MIGARLFVYLLRLVLVWCLLMDVRIIRTSISGTDILIPTPEGLELLAVEPTWFGLLAACLFVSFQIALFVLERRCTRRFKTSGPVRPWISLRGEAFVYFLRLLLFFSLVIGAQVVLQTFVLSTSLHWLDYIPSADGGWDDDWHPVVITWTNLLLALLFSGAQIGLFVLERRCTARFKARTEMPAPAWRTAS